MLVVSRCYSGLLSNYCHLHRPDPLMLLFVCWTWGRRPSLCSGWLKVSSNSLSALSRRAIERQWDSKASLSGSKARVSCCRLLKSISFLLGRPTLQAKYRYKTLGADYLTTLDSLMFGKAKSRRGEGFVEPNSSLRAPCRRGDRPCLVPRRRTRPSRSGHPPPVCARADPLPAHPQSGNLLGPRWATVPTLGVLLTLRPPRGRPLTKNRLHAGRLAAPLLGYGCRALPRREPQGCQLA